MSVPGQSLASPADHVINCICGSSQDDGLEPMVNCRRCDTWQHITCYFRPGARVDHDEFDHICAVCRPNIPLGDMATLIKRQALLRGGPIQHDDDGLKPLQSWVQLISEAIRASPCRLLTGLEISAAIAARYAFWRNEPENHGSESRLRSNVSSILSQNSSTSSSTPYFFAYRFPGARSNRGSYWALVSELTRGTGSAKSVKTTTISKDTIIATNGKKRPAGDALIKRPAGKGSSAAAISGSLLPNVLYRVRNNRSSSYTVEATRSYLTPWASLSQCTTFEVGIDHQPCAVGDLVSVAMEDHTTEFALIYDVRSLETGLLSALVCWFYSKESALLHTHTRKKRDQWPGDQTHLLSNELEIINAASISGKLGREQMTQSLKIVDANPNRGIRVRDSSDLAVSWVGDSLKRLGPASSGNHAPSTTEASSSQFSQIRAHVIWMGFLLSVEQYRRQPWRGNSKGPYFNPTSERLARRLYLRRGINVHDFDIFPKCGGEPRLVLLHTSTWRIACLNYKLPRHISLTFSRDSAMPKLQVPAGDGETKEVQEWLQREKKELCRIVKSYEECKAFVMEDLESLKGRWWESLGEMVSEKEVKDWRMHSFLPDHELDELLKGL